MDYKKDFLLVLILLSANICFGQVAYPVPLETDRMLFYIQRSHNKNTVIYDLNILPDGKVDVKNPVNIYWIRYEEGGRKAELSRIHQRVFGVRCRLADKLGNTFILQFNSFIKREVHIIKLSSGVYNAYTKINNEMAQLKSVFIKADMNAAGLPLLFRYIDINGVSAKNKQKISERINMETN